MLKTIGAKKIEDLFAEIPASLRTGELKHVPPGMTEMAVKNFYGAESFRTAS